MMTAVCIEPCKTDIFEFAERYETSRFWEGSETRCPKHSRSKNLQNTREGKKIGFQIRESGFGAFPKSVSFVLCGILEVQKLVKAKRFELS